MRAGFQSRPNSLTNAVRRLIIQRWSFRLLDDNRTPQRTSGGRARFEDQIERLGVPASNQTQRANTIRWHLD